MTRDGASLLVGGNTNSVECTSVSVHVYVCMHLKRDQTEAKTKKSNYFYFHLLSDNYCQKKAADLHVTVSLCPFVCFKAVELISFHMFLLKQRGMLLLTGLASSEI